MQQAIAILDSGVGGLTVAGEIMRQLPNEEILYFGDTARAPYGHRTPSEVLLFTRQIVDYLLHFDPKMIVIACNTATAAALPAIQQAVSIPVVGVIEPGARAAAKYSEMKSIGVVGTEGTIRSGAYDRALTRLSPEFQVVSLACPAFVPLVEQGLHRTEEARRVVQTALSPIAAKPMDCLILGCTHYPFLSEYISEVMGPHVKLISSAEETAREVQDILIKNGLENQKSEEIHHRFLCSGNPAIFRSIAESWLNMPVEVTQVVWPLIRAL